MALALSAGALFGGAATAMAQSTGTLSGIVTDVSGAVVPGATITAVNQATKDVRTSTTNADGSYVFAGLFPGIYNIKAQGKGFSAKELAGIELHAADALKVPDLSLIAGAADVVTVETTTQMLTTENGQRNEVLSFQDIQDLALEGRDTTELLKVLPGVVNQTSGNNPTYNALNVTAGQSAIGQGLNANGAPNRGGTTILIDGINTIDPGADFSSLVTLNPEMTREVAVLSSNFGADVPFGPVVISSTSKSGSSSYHGEGYFVARNDALNAIDWQTKHVAAAAGTAPQKGGAAYYYPGFNMGGPVPFTHKKVFFFAGAEGLVQNTGVTANSTINSWIPSPEMLAGNFTNDNADNQALCPNGFTASTTARWCNDLSQTILSDGTHAPFTTGVGGRIPAQYIDPNMIALSKLWPKANLTTAQAITANGGANYHVVVPNQNNGYIARVRIDYDPSDKDKFFVSYQHGFSRQLANNNGANLYYSPGGSLQFPGGGIVTTTYSRAVSGHWTHIFTPTATNEFVASYVYGNIPIGPQNPAGDYRSTLGYNVPSVYGTSALFAPSYGTGGLDTFPNFSQADAFEPNGFYPVKKQIPSFSDDFTKVYGTHTIKVGAFTENVDNFQGNMATYLNGQLTIAGGPAQNYTCAANCPLIGSYNNTANFITGTLSNYVESNSSPVQDTAYQQTSFYVNDVWKASRKLTLEFGARFEHIGHWYDRQGNGIAVFIPSRVLSDFNSGKVNPGFYWHGIDPGIPLSGQPNHLLLVAPRFGMSYDVFGNGKTLVRGGWGEYRFQEQYNNVSNALATAQAVQQYTFSTVNSGKTLQLSQVSNLIPAKIAAQTLTTSSQTGLDSTDYGVPQTYAYNLTIDQQLPFKMVLDVAYVGNQTHQLLDTGATQSGGGASYTGFANQNKTPLGAFFKPDPVTGVTSPNPENLGGPGSTANKSADYRPYGYAYGTNSVFWNQSKNYGNYNALQAAISRRGQHLTINANFTWSKALGINNNNNPFDIRRNYTFLTTSLPFVFNSSYYYRVGDVYHGNFLVGEALNGWTISGISTVQSGPNVNPTVSISYQNGTTPTTGGYGTGLGSNSYFGTDAGLAILPVLTCNPKSNLPSQGIYNNCFAPPPLTGNGQVSQNGGQAFPFISGPKYIENDLALYKSFKIHKEQNVQFRITAYNWLNHPLSTFSPNSGDTTLYYTFNYNSRTPTLNTGTATGQTLPTFGQAYYRAGAPTQRIYELNLKYNF